ncbi:hypothetical protein [Enterococcus mundtii]|uniref:Uncharacterized protein n=1 Tax=Enterococcus mundtii TaxID=53346 RepID=A0ABQ0VA30_ENTMU|nr:hypothetical protein [Enterococcus mundtii]GEN18882.1 hypothetical protein LAC02_21630 [Ligilactobacillus acidipiscis]AUB52473.1 hypothetical protein EM4838_05585 [Enterococcus mundtii]OJG60039.1 hypothetical protein RV08_GL000767 [Enterococcus mundtii]PTO41938.1 hypothetical protein C6P50_05315 [Enterococcus mundtii]SFL90654.1 hypothetical protein SAMN04487758_10572 [Enterococcus mundtii]
MFDEQIKGLEKALISWFIASHSRASSDTKKKTIQVTRDLTNQELKDRTKQYTDRLTDAAKGEWVDQAMSVVKDITKAFS